MDATFVKVWQAVVSGLSIGSIYALIAQGYYVTFITTATLNFGQGELLMIGALVGLTAYVGFGLPFPISLLIALAITVLMRVALDRVAIPR